MDELDYDQLDPGIRETVRWLRSHGFETTDSGDGESKLRDGVAPDDGILDYPHVFMHVDPSCMVSEAVRLKSLLGEGSAGFHIELSYSPNDGVAVLALFRDSSKTV